MNGEQTTEKAKVGVSLDQPLVTDLKVLAARNQQTLTSLVVERLTRALEDPEALTPVPVGDTRHKLTMVLPVELWTQVKIAAARKRTRLNTFVAGALR